MARPTPLYGKDVNQPVALAAWMVLASGAGATNAIAFLACARFVTHVTGVATVIGTDAADLEHALDYSLVLAAFIGGAFTSEFVLGSGPIRKGIGRALWIVASVLALVAVLGMLGGFDAFGSQFDDPRTFLFLGALAFAMGLQNGAVATATGGRVRTTHMTGPATDLGVGLARMLSPSHKERYAARQLVALRGIKLSGFIAGAGLGALLVSRGGGYLALLFPAALCFGIGLLIAHAPTPIGGSKKIRPVEKIPTSQSLRSRTETCAHAQSSNTISSAP